MGKTNPKVQVVTPSRDGRDDCYDLYSKNSIFSHNFGSKTKLQQAISEKENVWKQLGNDDYVDSMYTVRFWNDSNAEIKSIWLKTICTAHGYWYMGQH